MTNRMGILRCGVFQVPFLAFIRKDLGKASEAGSVCRARFEPRIFVI